MGFIRLLFLVLLNEKEKDMFTSLFFLLCRMRLSAGSCNECHQIEKKNEKKKQKLML